MTRVWRSLWLVSWGEAGKTVRAALKLAIAFMNLSAGVSAGLVMSLCLKQQCHQVAWTGCLLCGIVDSVMLRGGI